VVGADPVRECTYLRGCRRRGPSDEITIALHVSVVIHSPVLVGAECRALLRILPTLHIAAGKSDGIMWVVSHIMVSDSAPAAALLRICDGHRSHNPYPCPMSEQCNGPVETTMLTILVSDDDARPHGRVDGPLLVAAL